MSAQWKYAVAAASLVLGLAGWWFLPRGENHQTSKVAPPRPGQASSISEPPPLPDRLAPPVDFPPPPLPLLGPVPFPSGELPPLPKDGFVPPPPPRPKPAGRHEGI